MFNKEQKNTEKMYEENLIDVKSDHFQRINNLMEENLQLKQKIMLLESQTKIKIQEVESEYENIILQLKQQLVVERSMLDVDRLKIETEKETALLGAERQIVRTVAKSLPVLGFEGYESVKGLLDE